MYKEFATYVIENFFTDDKKGEFAALVIDDQFIKNAAKKNDISKEELIKSLSKELYNNDSKNIDYYFVLAAISLQLYAASKCETDIEYSAIAYNPRLCEILNCDVSFL